MFRDRQEIDELDRGPQQIVTTECRDVKSANLGGKSGHVSALHHIARVHKETIQGHGRIEKLIREDTLQDLHHGWILCIEKVQELVPGDLEKGERETPGHETEPTVEIKDMGLTIEIGAFERRVGRRVHYGGGAAVIVEHREIIAIGVTSGNIACAAVASQPGDQTAGRGRHDGRHRVQRVGRVTVGSLSQRVGDPIQQHVCAQRGRQRRARVKRPVDGGEPPQAACPDGQHGPMHHRDLP